MYMVVGLAMLMTLQSLRNEALTSRAIWLRSVAVGVMAVLLMFTHYFAGGGCIAMGVFAAFCLPKRARWVTLASLFIGAIIWGVLWTPTLLQQLRVVPETTDIYLHESEPGWTQRTLMRVAASPWTQLADSNDQTFPLRAFLGILIGVAAGVAVYRNRREGIIWALWIVGIVGPLAIMDIARHTGQLKLMRYMLPAAPGLIILLSLHARHVRGTRPVWRNIPALILVGEIIVLACQGNPLQITDVRPMMTFLKQNVQRGDVLVLPSVEPHGRDGQLLYLYLCHYTDLLPYPLVSCPLIRLVPR